MDTYEALLAAATARGTTQFAALAANETTEDYLRRLVKAVGEISLDQFNALPMAARDWYDASADALQAALPVPMPDGFDRASPRLGAEPARADPAPPRPPAVAIIEASPMGRG